MSEPLVVWRVPCLLFITMHDLVLQNYSLGCAWHVCDDLFFAWAVYLCAVLDAVGLDTRRLPGFFVWRGAMSVRLTNVWAMYAASREGKQNPAISCQSVRSNSQDIERLTR